MQWRPADYLTDWAHSTGNDAVAGDDGAMSDEERAWGLAPPRDYAEILTKTIERDYRPRFAARAIELPGELPR